MVSHPLIFLGIMPHCVISYFFFFETITFHKDAQKHKHLLLKGDRNLADFIAV